MINLWERWILILDRPWFLWSLIAINFGGSIYGFYWYKDQLATIGGWLNLFVPDSPTASSAFTLVLLLFAFRKKNHLLEAFAAVTLFKYGIWAVVMIVAGAAFATGPFFAELSWQHWMLIGSHLGMAAQAVLYSRFYTFQARHLLMVGAWTYLNDALDYGLGIHPWVASSLQDKITWIGMFTVGLSAVSLYLFYRLVVQKVR